MVGHLGTTSLTNRRRVHEDGRRLLENQLAIKQSEMKASILENRLKHLENEEQKAQRKLKEAEQTANDLLNRRERNQEKNEQKLKQILDKQAEIENRRQINAMIKQQRQQAIQENRQRILEVNRLNKSSIQ